MSRPVILAFARYYLPGYKAGGPIRSIGNLVAQLGDEFDFHVVASDRDLGDAAPYANVTMDVWSPVEKATVMYLSRDQQGFRGLARLLRRTPHDAVCLNSFFDPVFSAVPLFLRRTGLAPRKPYLVAPRGEFSQGALALKALKKQFYLRAVCIGGFVDDVVWQASSEYEAAEIIRACGVDPTHVCVVPNPASSEVDESSSFTSLYRDPGMPLKVLFLSRISPMKNLQFALQVLGRTREPIQFDVYGPVTDEIYWQQCQKEMASLPSHIKVQYHGAVPPERVREIMADHDLFFLPTRGENFGHVIAEALSAGLPVLISDTTPWRDLKAAGVGWDLSLHEEQSFLRCIEHCARLGAEEYDAWRASIRRFAVTRLSDPEVIKANRTVLLNALAGRR